MKADGKENTHHGAGQCLHFQQRVKHFQIKEFVFQLPIERFHIAALPCISWLYSQGLHREPSQPLSHRPGCELRSIARSYVFRCHSHKELPIQSFRDITRGDTAAGQDFQAFSRVFINDHHCLQRHSARCSGHHETIAPHVIFVLGSQPDTGVFPGPHLPPFSCLFCTFSPPLFQIRSTLL